MLRKGLRGDGIVFCLRLRLPPPADDRAILPYRNVSEYFSIRTLAQSNGGEGERSRERKTKPKKGTLAQNR